MHPFPTEIPQHLQPLNWHRWLRFCCIRVFSPRPFPHISVLGNLFIIFITQYLNNPFWHFLYHPLSWPYLYISYLHNSCYAPSTMNTYISALGYCHKLMGLSDPSKVFCLSNAQGIWESRLSPRFSSSNYASYTKQTCCCRILSGRFSVSDQSISGYVFSGLYAILRIGEITSVSKQGAPPPLHLYQLT